MKLSVLDERKPTFARETAFCEILTLEHLHVVSWLYDTPCKVVRGRQVLSVPQTHLERYVISLDPVCLMLLFNGLYTEDRQSLLYRLTPTGAAKMLYRVLPRERAGLLALVDHFPHEKIIDELCGLPKDFY